MARAPVFPSDWIPAFEAHAEEMMAAYDLPGLAVAMARRGIAVYARGFGHRDREAGLEVTPDTVFGIGSITKSFTCLAIMQLQEEGRLSVHDPVVRYLPEFRTPDPEATRRMTIHHFMTHTAGLPPLPTLFYALARSMEGDPSVENFPLQIDTAGHGPIDTYDQLLEFLANHPYALLGPPGARFSYSNDAYALLGCIVERVAGEPYERFVQRRILEPAGMTRTTFDLEVLGSFPEVTTLYATRNAEGREEVFRAPQWWHAPAMTAAGFIRSTVRDLLRYLEVYRTGGLVNGERILEPDSVAQMVYPHVACAPGMAYGYGLMLTPEYHGLSLVEHGGGIKGVSAYVSVVPEAGLSAAVLTNLAAVPSGEILLGAVNAAVGLPLGTRRATFAPYACPADRLPAYVGEYRSGEGAAVSVTAEDGALVFETMGKRLPARPVGEHAFAIRHKEDEMYARFELGGDGAAEALVFGFRIIGRAPAASRDIA